MTACTDRFYEKKDGFPVGSKRGDHAGNASNLNGLQASGAVLVENIDLGNLDRDVEAHRTMLRYDGPRGSWLYASALWGN